jgi:hypothetical protein
MNMHPDLGPYVFLAAIVAIAAVALAMAATGHAPPVILSAFAQALQALSRGLLWALHQRNGLDDRDPHSS